jgi:hypothetical protein
MLRPRALVVLALAGSLSCEDSSSRPCPDSWVDAEEDRCEAPAEVVEAAEANLGTGIYGYMTRDRPSDCDGSERELARAGYFHLYPYGEDVDEASAEGIRVAVVDQTFEVEVPPGQYFSTSRLGGGEGALRHDDEIGQQALVLEVGDVVLIIAQLSCGMGS